MSSHLNLPQLMMLFGGAVFVVSALIVGVYILQKAFRRTLKAGELKPDKVRVDDEATFTLAAVKAVLTQLKADQKAAQEELIRAERQADVNTRKFTQLAGELDRGLIIIDADGYLSFSNPLARKLLAADTLSHRQYREILQDTPAVLDLIGGCFETRAEVRNKIVEWQGAEGATRRVEVTVLPSVDRSGVTDFVACVIREVGAPTSDAMLVDSGPRNG